MLSIENGVLGRSSRKKKTVTNPSVTHFCLCLGKKAEIFKRIGDKVDLFSFFLLSLDYFSTHYWLAKCKQCLVSVVFHIDLLLDSPFSTLKIK